MMYECFAEGGGHFCPKQNRKHGCNMDTTCVQHVSSLPMAPTLSAVRKQVGGRALICLPNKFSTDSPSACCVMMKKNGSSLTRGIMLDNESLVLDKDQLYPLVCVLRATQMEHLEHMISLALSHALSYAWVRVIEGSCTGMASLYLNRATHSCLDVMASSVSARVLEL